MMSDSSLNIKFNYLYRDAGNYKQFGHVIFSNPDNVLPEILEESIKSILIDGLYFVASKWQIPSLYKFSYDEELDHSWHEFEKVELTEEPATEKRSIQEFLSKIEIAPKPNN